jgi:hypothetical protein
MLEAAFSQELSPFLKNTTSSGSEGMSLFCSEVAAIIEHHSSLANQIGSKLLPPIQNFQDVLSKEHKRLIHMTSLATEAFRSVEKKRFLVESDAQKARIDALVFSNSKNGKTRRSLKAFEKELGGVKSEQDLVIQKVNEIQIPELLNLATELDFSVRTTLKNAIMNLSDFENRTHNDITLKLTTVLEGADRFEPDFETRVMAESLGLLSSKDRVFAVVKCSFPGGSPNDLSISRGEYLEVLQQHPSGWWEGEINGRRGMFPMNFVEVVTEDSNGGRIIGEIFEIEGKHASCGDDEIDLDFGDVVFVGSVKDDWCFGHRIGSEMHGKFPRNIVRGLKNHRL